MSQPAEGSGGAGKRRRWPLALLLALFMGPLAGAAVVYWQAGAWLGSNGGAQHGQLLDPVRPVGPLALRDLSGSSTGTEAFRGKWTLVFVGPGDCGPRCREALYKIRQAHKAQGRNIGRVRRLYLAVGEPPSAPVRHFLERKHPRLGVVRPAVGEKLGRFRAAVEGPPTGIYLLDPHANLVLRYGPDAAAEGILEDLEHLLKHSTIG